MTKTSATCRAIQALRSMFRGDFTLKHVRASGIIVSFGFDLMHVCPLNRHNLKALPCDDCVRLHPGAPPITAPRIAKRRSRPRGRRGGK